MGVAAGAGVAVGVGAGVGIGVGGGAGIGVGGGGGIGIGGGAGVGIGGGAGVGIGGGAGVGIGGGAGVGIGGGAGVGVGGGAGVGIGGGAGVGIGKNRNKMENLYTKALFRAPKYAVYDSRSIYARIYGLLIEAIQFLKLMLRCSLERTPDLLNQKYVLVSVLWLNEQILVHTVEGLRHDQSG